MKRFIGIGFFYVGAMTMLVMSMHFFQNEISGILKYKEVSEHLLFRLCFKSHILFGIIAIFTGPTQFSTKLRLKRLDLHRRLGYVYFVSVMISALMGLGIAPFAMGGMISTLGFSTLAVFWLISAIRAITSIRRKDVVTHKKWMFINYGLTFAAITQRTLLLIPLFTNIEFIWIYKISAWLPWMLNTAIALYLFNRSEAKRLITNK